MERRAKSKAKSKAEVKAEVKVKRKAKSKWKSKWSACIGVACEGGSRRHKSRDEVSPAAISQEQTCEERQRRL